MQWYYRIRDRTEGPLDDAQIQQLVRDGKMGRLDLLRNERSGDQWLPLHQFPMLACLAPDARQKDPVREAEFRRNLAVAEEQQRRQKTAAWCISVAAAMVVAAILAAIVYAKLTAPYRAFGVSAANPVG